VAEQVYLPAAHPTRVLSLLASALAQGSSYRTAAGDRPKKQLTGTPYEQLELTPEQAT
jgi:hypothetical protein